MILNPCAGNGFVSEELLQEHEVLNLSLDGDLLGEIRPHGPEFLVQELLEVLGGAGDDDIRLFEGGAAEIEDLSVLQLEGVFLGVEVDVDGLLEMFDFIPRLFVFGHLLVEFVNEASELLFHGHVITSR